MSATNYIFENFRLSDEFKNAFIRVLSKAYCQCADIGECFATISQIESNYDSWHTAWQSLAAKVEIMADASWDANHIQVAAMSYLRAAEYYRAAIYFCSKSDPNFKDHICAMRKCFERAISVIHYRFQKMSIMTDDVNCEGYFFPSSRDNIRGTLIMPSDLDSCVEESYGIINQGLAQGYNVLIFDGPGSGHVLWESQKTICRDYGKVIAEVIDFLQVNSECSQYILVGRGVMGYYAAKAACAEPRLAALICDTLQADLYSLLQDNNSDPYNFSHFFDSFGVSDITSLAKKIQRENIEEDLYKISCPTLVCDNEHDIWGSNTFGFYTKLDCTKTYYKFDDKLGASMDCEYDAQGQFARVIFSWLENQFADLKVL